ncbi:MAG: hypothetical protein MZV70_41815 [Desulfobacterales bacterium]|nr:hypothetical protein [Desulfobacterales bacterium]
MRPYFEKMKEFGSALPAGKIKSRRNQRQADQGSGSRHGRSRRQGQERRAARPTEINKRKQLTVWQRLEYLRGPRHLVPAQHALQPQRQRGGHQQRRSTAWPRSRANGRWSSASTTRCSPAPGCPARRRTSCGPPTSSKRLNIPLVWLVNCSGVKLPEQEKFYADRRGGGTTFFRHAELEQAGVPILAGIYGTNPAGGGYQSISPTILFAHKDANMAVGGGGHPERHVPQGLLRPRGRRAADRGRQAVQGRAAGLRQDPPRRHRLLPPCLRHRAGGAGRHQGLHEGHAGLRPEVLPRRRARPSRAFPAEDLYYLVPFNQKQTYNFDEVLARLVDGSEHMEYRPGYGPEVYTGSGQDRRLPGGRHRQPPGLPRRGLPRVRVLPRHRRQALPPGADQDERVRGALRPRPRARHLVPGHDRHRRRRHRREGRAARPGAVADLLDPADRRPA